MPYGLTPGGRTRKRKRLKDIQSFEVAIVPRGANQAQFVVMKEDSSMKLDLQKLTEAHTTLGRIVTVCKSGTPAAETVETLSQDLQQITLTLSSLLGNSAQTVSNVSDLKSDVETLNTIAEGLSGSTYDLNVQDQIDTLVEKLHSLSERLDAVPAEPVVVEEPTTEETVEQEATTAETSTETPTEELTQEAAPTKGTNEESVVQTEADKSAEEVAVSATEEVTTADAGETTAEITEETQAETTEPVIEKSETVTKADLEAFGKTLADGFKEALANLGTTLKSADTGRPTLLYPAGNAEETETGSIDTEAQDESHWGPTFDLNAE